MTQTNRFGGVGLLIGLGLAAVVPAVGQLTAADIAALRERGAREGWTFTVGENGATGYSLEQLTGAVEPANWAADLPIDTRPVQRDLPVVFDYRTQGLPPIRNQGGCGSCWAFAAIGTLECNYKLREGLTLDLSEQWLVSCTSAGTCNGGWHTEAYKYLQPGWLTDGCGGGGAVLETAFPYAAADVPCQCPYPHPYGTTNWALVGSGWSVAPVAAIKQALLDHGPVSACIYVNTAFQAYTGGVFNACEDQWVNHVVVIVGWDDRVGTNGAWIIRNSWGAGWGVGGYGRIEYGCCNIGYATCYSDTPSVTTVSGRVLLDGSGVAGAELAGLPGNPSTDSTGYYCVPVPDGWSGTVTPSKPGHVFEPPSRTLSNLTSDATADFSAHLTTAMISGAVYLMDGAGVAGVRMVGLPGEPLTDENGLYSATVLYGWTGTVTPTLGTHPFTPSQRTYFYVTQDQPGGDYTRLAWPVYGRVAAPNGRGIAGVMLVGFPEPTATDADGAYTTWVDHNWGGTVMPARPGYAFTPAERTYSSVIRALPPQNYSALAAVDCDGNGLCDGDDLAAGAADCNGNGILDGCEIASGGAADANGNGIPDACELRPGDTNCDGAVNFDDIDGFVAALGGAEGYGAAYPGCAYLSADCNGDGAVNFDDIDAFIALLGS